MVFFVLASRVCVLDALCLCFAFELLALGKRFLLRRERFFGFDWRCWRWCAATTSAGRSRTSSARRWLDRFGIEGRGHFFGGAHRDFARSCTGAGSRPTGEFGAGRR